eukprot:TRINITY_DN14746_c0_g1_i1.p1 TRINITY_DN14746_c0_g1~~TRINITY_DN14746_c0_g1_i1.p1  ORF type:complete len:492 (-),score=97.10 TRINITY_DN14746_c0_g1_i1:33-1508(-)
MGQSASLSSLVFQPPNPPSYTTDLQGLFWIPTESRNIPAVAYRWRDRESDKTSEHWILYSCGNQEDQGTHVEWFKLLKETLKVNILTYDYLGYGLTQGVPSEKACCEDIFSVYNFMIEQMGVQPSKLILYGKSIGSGPTLELALFLAPLKTRGSLTSRVSKRFRSSLPSALKAADLGNISLEPSTKEAALAGVILQSPMTSVLRIDESANLISLASTDMFENVKKVDKIKVPFYFVHGAEDQVINCSHSRKLSDRVPRLWKYTELPGMDHFNIEQEQCTDVLDDLIAFLEFLDPSLVQTKVLKVAPDAIRFSPQMVISSFLRENNLQDRLAQNFLAAGFFDIDSIATMDELDIPLLNLEEEESQAVYDAIMGLKKSREANDSTTERRPSLQRSTSFSEMEPAEMTKVVRRVREYHRQRSQSMEYIVRNNNLLLTKSGDEIKIPSPSTKIEKKSKKSSKMRSSKDEDKSERKPKRNSKSSDSQKEQIEDAKQ